MAPSPTPLEGSPAEGTINVPAPLAEPVVTERGKAGEAFDLGSSNEGMNRLVEAINEQSASLKTVLEFVTKAVEALKPQPQSTDKTIAFWTEYKRLADEYDKEFNERYGQDLDTTLIFAGLFSAVSSAFITQIQPELKPDPNAPTQALVAFLVQNFTGQPSALLPPGVVTSQPTAPPVLVVVAQSLLYFSLFTTLLVALLAVLGKQWLFHYNSVVERGTIAERGIERQRKFDGMRRFRFDLVMQVFPLLLQFSLLLFAIALSFYLWAIHHVVAAIPVMLTGLGSTLYGVMFIAAVVSSDSPFQTSLSVRLRSFLDQLSVSGSLRGLVGPSKRLHPPLRHACAVLSHFWTACADAITARMVPLLPLFHGSNPHSPDSPHAHFRLSGSPFERMARDRSVWDKSKYTWGLRPMLRMAAPKGGGKPLRAALIRLSLAPEGKSFRAAGQVNEDAVLTGWHIFSQTALMTRAESGNVEARTQYTQRSNTEELPAESQT
ncbi:hypothetical protein MVEN_02182500 [Mycena venus]|uniref:DUF6535 domain-containing protein n=1 Tax=Mycena venus TaxID=2733690 RepID=A0A8H7CGC4_9AGAR|nr:hypothetical protein MVEN_02182500 [Mycena venus]